MAKPAKKPTKSEYTKATDTSFSEVYEDVPESVEKSGKTGDPKRKMMIAIALSKARAKVKGRGKS